MVCVCVCVCVCACAYIFCVHYFLADERERGDTTRATSEYWPPHVVTEEHIQHYPQTAGKDRTVSINQHVNTASTEPH